MNETIERVIGIDSIDVDMNGICTIEYDFSIDYKAYIDPIFGVEYEITNVDLFNICGILGSKEIDLDNEDEIKEILEYEIVNGNRGIQLIEDRVLAPENWEQEVLINNIVEGGY